MPKDALKEMKQTARRARLPKPRALEQTFENFVVRRANRKAHAYLSWLSSRRLTAGATILCGASGSGKSHLLRASVARWKQRSKGLNVKSFAAADVFRRYVLPTITNGARADAVPTELVADVVIVEHLESLAEQPRSLEAVLKVCAALVANGMRVMVTITEPVLDARPRAIAKLAARAMKPSRIVQIVGARFDVPG